MGIASLMISGISLIVAIVSFIISRKSQFLQDRVNEIEIKLKEYELAEKEKEMHEVSNIEARINHSNNKNHLSSLTLSLIVINFNRYTCQGCRGN